MQKKKIKLNKKGSEDMLNLAKFLEVIGKQHLNRHTCFLIPFTFFPPPFHQATQTHLLHFLLMGCFKKFCFSSGKTFGCLQKNSCYMLGVNVGENESSPKLSTSLQSGEETAVVLFILPRKG